eukprot:Filipodium_phascolosomae@DN2741_c0_g1_i1.p1
MGPASNDSLVIGKATEHPKGGIFYFDNTGNLRLLWKQASGMLSFEEKDTFFIWIIDESVTDVVCVVDVVVTVTDVNEDCDFDQHVYECTVSDNAPDGTPICSVIAKDVDIVEKQPVSKVLTFDFSSETMTANSTEHASVFVPTEELEEVIDIMPLPIKYEKANDGTNNMVGLTPGVTFFLKNRLLLMASKIPKIVVRVEAYDNGYPVKGCSASVVVRVLKAANTCAKGTFWDQSTNKCLRIVHKFINQFPPVQCEETVFKLFASSSGNIDSSSVKVADPEGFRFTPNDRVIAVPLKSLSNPPEDCWTISALEAHFGHNVIQYWTRANYAVEDGGASLKIIQPSGFKYDGNYMFCLCSSVLQDDDGKPVASSNCSNYEEFKLSGGLFEVDDVNECTCKSSSVGGPGFREHSTREYEDKKHTKPSREKENKTHRKLQAISTESIGDRLAKSIDDRFAGSNEGVFGKQGFDDLSAAASRSSPCSGLYCDCVNEVGGYQCAYTPPPSGEAMKGRPHRSLQGVRANGQMSDSVSVEGFSRNKIEEEDEFIQTERTCRTPKTWNCVSACEEKQYVDDDTDPCRGNPCGINGECITRTSKLHRQSQPVAECRCFEGYHQPTKELRCVSSPAKHDKDKDHKFPKPPMKQPKPPKYPTKPKTPSKRFGRKL